MARAKRTERAEARRRYRAATTTVDLEDGVAEEVAIPAAAVPREQRERRSSAGPSSVPQPRQGFLGTLRAAAGPVDLRGDLRALPEILVKSKAGWVPGLVVAVTTVAMLVPAIASNQFVAMAFSIVLQPPPMIIAFLAGMLAPRAAWLMGGLASIVASLGYLLVYLTGTDVRVTPLAFTVTFAPADKLESLATIPMLLLSWALFGVAVGAFAGFYRRFLNMSGPQREGARRR